MLREIRVYGRLAKFLGRRTFKAAVGSAAEAIRFLLANFPQLEKHMADQYYRVSVGIYDLSLNELHDPAGQQTIRIIPVIGGAGGPAGSIAAGVALVALALVNPFGAAMIGTFGGTPIAVASLMPAVGLFGASLILGGVAQLLTPVPQIPDTMQDNSDPRKSYSFSGIQQTSRQGVPVPIVYGETVVGSIVISAGIDTVRIIS